MSSGTLERQGKSAVPAFITKDDRRGTENIGNDDIKFPALKLAQGLSPETKRNEAAYIEGLREGELFNSITKDNYGEEPVHIIIVNMLGHRNIQFDPQDRNVVLDGNVPDGDPRTQFTTRIDPATGKEIRVKPAATKFYDYLILLVREGEDPEVMTLSLKSTQLKKATQLNTILKKSKTPTFAHLFRAEPIPEKRGNNNYYGWRFDPAGWVTEEQYLAASKLYDSLAGKTVEVQDTGAADDPAAPGAPVADDDIPF